MAPWLGWTAAGMENSQLVLSEPTSMVGRAGVEGHPQISGPKIRKGYGDEHWRVENQTTGLEEISEELYTIVDLGGRVLDVFVNHQVYGELRADLFLVTREDIEWFNKKMALGKINPLKNLTGDIHYHTVEADSQEVLDKIQYALEEKGYLI